MLCYSEEALYIDFNSLYILQRQFSSRKRPSWGKEYTSELSFPKWVTVCVCVYFEKAHQEILIEFLCHHPHSIVCSWSSLKQCHWMYCSSWGKQQMYLCDLEISRHEPVSELSMPYILPALQKFQKEKWRMIEEKYNSSKIWR